MVEKIRYDWATYRICEKRTFYLTSEFISEIWNLTKGKVYFVQGSLYGFMAISGEYGDVVAEIRNMITEIAVRKVLRNPTLTEIVIDVTDLKKEHRRRIKRAMLKVQGVKIKSKLMKFINKFFNFWRW